MKIIINGRFLTQKITGVQRVGIEVTRELDKIARPGEIEIVSPPGIINEIDLKNIKLVVIGKKSSNGWVQLELPRYARKNHATILTMSGLPPIMVPDYYIAHDATFYRFPEAFTKRFVLSYMACFRLTLHRCKRVFTVSDFSKNELIDAFGTKEDKFCIISNSSEHLIEKEYDEIAVSRWQLTDEGYYLSVSSKAKHKNQNYIVECAKKYPQEKFVIVGGNPKSFSAYQMEQLDNLIYTGYVIDDELRSLYKHAKGFIFPSLYEGFGIPPLEAITLGIKHIAVSDIPVFREIYDKDVYYFDPKDSRSFDIKELEKITISNESLGYYREKYNWKKTAVTIYQEIRKNENQ